MHHPIGVTMVDRFEDLLNTMCSVSFRVELASHNVFKKLPSRHPETIETLRKREKEHLVKFYYFEFKEKLLFDEGARDDSDLRISSSFFCQTFHLFLSI